MGVDPDPANNPRLMQWAIPGQPEHQARVGGHYTPPARSGVSPEAPGRASRESGWRGGRPPGTRPPRREPEPARARERADRERRHGAERPADVVGRALGGRAQAGGEELRGHRPEAAEVAGAEERDQRTEPEQRPRIAHVAVHRHERGGHQQVRDVGGAAAETVAHEAEADVAEPHADLHQHDPGCALHDAEPGPAALPSTRRAAAETSGTRTVIEARRVTSRSATRAGPTAPTFAGGAAKGARFAAQPAISICSERLIAKNPAEHDPCCVIAPPR